jgi:hypothetical protein
MAITKNRTATPARRRLVAPAAASTRINDKLPGSGTIFHSIACQSPLVSIARPQMPSHRFVELDDTSMRGPRGRTIRDISLSAAHIRAGAE